MAVKSVKAVYAQKLLFWREGMGNHFFGFRKCLNKIGTRLLYLLHSSTDHVIWEIT